MIFPTRQERNAAARNLVAAEDKLAAALNVAQSAKHRSLEQVVACREALLRCDEQRQVVQLWKELRHAVEAHREATAAAKAADDAYSAHRQANFSIGQPHPLRPVRC